jgi:hypothetical protein
MSPEIVMVKFYRIGGLETIYFNAQRIKSRHDVFHGSVLSGRIHCLEDDQHTVLIVGVQLILNLGQFLAAVLQYLLSLLLVEVLALILGREILELDLLTWLHQEIFVFNDFVVLGHREIVLIDNTLKLHLRILRST